MYKDAALLYLRVDLAEFEGDRETRVLEQYCLDKLKQKTINSLDEKKFNLNSPRLNEWRVVAIEKLREDVDGFVSMGFNISVAVNTIAETQPSKDGKSNHPGFFSTTVSYFKNDTEEHLKRVG